MHTFAFQIVSNNPEFIKWKVGKFSLKLAEINLQKKKRRRNPNIVTVKLLFQKQQNYLLNFKFNFWHKYYFLQNKNCTRIVANAPIELSEDTFSTSTVLNSVIIIIWINQKVSSVKIVNMLFCLQYFGRYFDKMAVTYFWMPLQNWIFF